MAKILGLDLGTNSIGWAIINTLNKDSKIVDAGVTVFQEGVNRVKGVEASKAAERTAYRLARRQKYRRRLRKYETLKVLIEYRMCPLSIQDLNNWVKYTKGEKRTYPTNQEFLSWLKTDELSNYTPYALRAEAATHVVDKLKLGRALYHLAQRRGFLSNRKDLTKSSEGVVKTQIDEITQEKGDLTLGQYFYSLYQKGDKIRGNYTSRTYHYVEEFEKICMIQKIGEPLHNKLYSALFYQRPLKSQKQLVGNCIFESNKPRCPISHFLFEEFRMLQYINSIKYRNSGEQQFDFLSQQQKELIIPKFMRTSKSSFQFSDISKVLTPKGEEYIFNYKEKDSVKGSPVSAWFEKIFGENWRETRINYNSPDGTRRQYTIEDIWHVLFDFDNDTLLEKFAKEKLQLNEEQIKSFMKIPIQQGYAALSLKAIKRILPFLRMGELYSHAVFLANIPMIVKPEIWRAEQNQHKIISEIHNLIKEHNEEKPDIAIINTVLKQIRDEEKKQRSLDFSGIDELIQNYSSEYFGSKNWEKLDTTSRKQYTTKIWNSVQFVLNTRMSYYQVPRIDERIDSFLRANYETNSSSKINIYHPSDVSFFDNISISQDGKKYLMSPEVPAIKNPMAMRTMHQLRKLINYLLEKGKIDEHTQIHIELANELNDKNKRVAIRKYQKEKETDREGYGKEVISFYKEHFDQDIIPTTSEILKYQLWEEQNHMCLYTGEQIGLSQFLGNNPSYDLEHTIARSFSYDNSQENLTLCSSKFNRNIKKQFLPTELSQYPNILQRIEEVYLKPLKDIEIKISKLKMSSINEDKDTKDRRIQQKEYLYLKKRYLQEKYRRFTMDNVPEGFKKSQLNDTRIITKYAAQYLKTSFTKVFAIKGTLTAEFRKLWGLQKRYEKKERNSHIHHTIDAIVLCGITRENYQRLATMIKGENSNGIRNFPLPWETLVSDIDKIVDEILVVHHTTDRALQDTKKKLRKGGKIQYKDKETKNHPIYIQGDCVRGQLHEETRYGAIIAPPHDKLKGSVRFVVRQSVDTLTKENVKNIVDARIRSLFEETIANGTFKDVIKTGLFFPTKDSSKSPTIIRKIRVYTPTIKDPVRLKDNSNISKHAHKQKVYVVNKTNYLVALYGTIDKNGKKVQDFELISLLSASKNKVQPYPLNKTKSGVLLPLKQVLKVGDIVLLKQTDDEDVWATPELLKDRLFQITGLSKSGGCKIHLILHHEARVSSTLKDKNGLFKIEEAANENTSRMLYSSQIIALVNNVDFRISPSGIIQRLLKEDSDA